MDGDGSPSRAQPHAGVGRRWPASEPHRRAGRPVAVVLDGQRKASSVPHSSSFAWPSAKMLSTSVRVGTRGLLLGLRCWGGFSLRDHEGLRRLPLAPRKPQHVPRDAQPSAMRSTTSMCCNWRCLDHFADTTGVRYTAWRSSTVDACLGLHQSEDLAKSRTGRH